MQSRHTMSAATAIRRAATAGKRGVRGLHTAPAEGSRRNAVNPLHFEPGQSSTKAKDRAQALIREHDRIAPRPDSPFLTDKHHRRHTYLRISLTEKCNLRCMYCMPEEGVPLTPHDSLLTSSEVARLARLFVTEGVDKIRLTGGEPTVRRDLPDVIGGLSELKPLGLKQIGITTNGITLSRHLSSLVSNGLTHLNISLDTLDPFKFELMTRRSSSGLDKVLRGIDVALAMGVPHVKLNVVVIKGLNDSTDVLDFVEWARTRDVTVRFIEYMPFDGNHWKPEKLVPFQKLLQTISDKYGPLERLQDDANDTSKHWRVPGHVGRIGFITSMTEHFCGTCNRLRITADGNLKVCLFGNAEVSLRDAMRMGLAEQGSLPASDRQLLEIIGAAVGRKHARHAGMTDLKALAEARTSSRSVWRRTAGRESLMRRLRLQPLYTFQRSQLRLYSTGGKGHQSWSKYMGTDAEGDDSPWASLDAIADAAQDFAKPMTPTRPAEPQVQNQAQTETLDTWEESALAAADRHAAAAMDVTNRPETYPAHQAAQSTNRLTHVDEQGSGASMVDVSNKQTTVRMAQAEGKVYITDAIVRLLKGDELDDVTSSIVRHKGPVLQTAQLAGIMGAKRTSELIPLCHGLHLSHVDVKLEIVSTDDTRIPPASSEMASHQGGFTLDELENWPGQQENEAMAAASSPYIHVTCTAKTSSQTGVEMEALTGASVACLTLWDMLKSVGGKEMHIDGLMVTSKQGGKSGDWQRQVGGLGSSDE